METPETPSEALDRLAQDFVERARRGEDPSIEDCAREHPDLAGEIRELFPLLLTVEGLKAPEAEPTLPALDVPERVGPYRIVRGLGRGGMGSVYEGEGEGDRTRVAIKVIHAHLLEDESCAARFLNEAEAGRTIEHQNVVRTLGTGTFETGGATIPYIVLEYVDGQNLRELLREVGVVPERLCRHVGRRLAEALAAVHAAGLIHRDVKPENVVITPDETVKLMDLGVVVLQDAANRLSRTGQFVGSLRYAAPEQLHGGDPDPGWDLYSLGVLLYELSTGRHPSRGAASPRDEDHRVSAFFDGCVQALLASEPSERFACAVDLARVLAEGEQSDWWRTRRQRASPLAQRLLRLERPTQFVGRETEWHALDGLLAAARKGRGRVALLVGEAGMGKSRLMHEWLAALERGPDPPLTLVVSHGPGAIESDEGGLAGALCDALEGEDLERRLRELLGTREQLAEPFARDLRGQSEGTPLDVGRREAAYDRVLAALARERGLVILYEDLHFAPDETRTQLVHFAHALGRERVLLIGTMRPVPAPDWAHALSPPVHVTRMELEGLDSTACRDLLQEAAKLCPHLEPNIARLTDRTDRNPFLLLEFVRDCMRSNATSESIGSEASIPESVRGFIGVRLASLEASDRELLEAASCCGHEFDPIVVADAAGLGRIAALKRFGYLERHQGLLHSAGRRYRFRHHLVQEVLYAEVHPALLEAYHAALGTSLEAHADVLPEGPFAVALCRHFLEGHEPERARPHLRKALEHLNWEEHDLAGVAELARKALGVGGLLVGEDRAYALWVVGVDDLNHARVDDVRGPLVEALALAQAAQARVLESELHLVLALMHRLAKEFDEAEASHLRAAASAREAGDPVREALAYARLAYELQNLGRLDDAERVLGEGLDALGEDPDPYGEGRLLTYLAAVHIRRGRSEEAEPLLERGRRLAHAAGDLYTEMFSLSESAQLTVRRGEIVRGLEFQERCLEVEREIAQPQLEMDTLGNITGLLVTLGSLAEAGRRIDEASAIAEQRGNPEHLAHVRMRRGGVRKARGELGGALEDLRAALEGALGVRRPSLAVVTAADLVEVLALLGRVSEASEVLAQAEDAVGPDGPVELRIVNETTRARLEELHGRYEDALATNRQARARSPVGGLQHERLAFAVGRCRLLAGRSDGAAELLQTAAAWGRASGDLRMGVLPQAWLATLPEGDVLAARVALEQGAASLPAAERIEAWFALWRASAEEPDLENARRYVEDLRAGAPPEDRDAVRARYAPFAPGGT